MSHIFISYARVDGDGFAKQLRNDLERAGVSTWLDVYNIPKGADWDAEIDEGLSRARAIVVILTPGATVSLQVKSEWNYAVNRLIPVIPLYVTKCSIPRVLQVFNYISFADAGYETALADLLSRLNGLDDDHLGYLKRLLSALETAQQEHSDPRRFLVKIDDLRHTIENWNQRISQQKERIKEGIEEQRQHAFDTLAQTRSRLRVVGRPPQDVSDYFKDRVHERHEIGRLLADPSTRLISVIGRGGMGKTAISVKVLFDLEQNHWPHTEEHIPVDGIVYLSTRTRGVTLERIYLDCAQMLGGMQEEELTALWRKPQVSTTEKVEQLLHALNQGLYIILLDNLEDVIDEHGQIADPDLQMFLERSLSTSHSARLLVTSREPLALNHEVIRYDHQIALADGLPEDDAVQLLRELDSNGNYGLRNESVDNLARIVRLVRGVPRALEITVAILANDPFATISDIEARFFEQEYVMKHLIQDNFKRLDLGARRVIEALSVFNRPITLVAIDFLLEKFGAGLNVPEIVKRLAKTHVISVDRLTKTISLHPIDRDYAYNQLPAADRQAMEIRAAQFYEQLRMPQDRWKTINDLHPHLCEFEHRVNATQYSEAAQLLNQIDFDYLLPLGHTQRSIRMRRQLLDHVTDKHLKQLNLGYLGRALYDAGIYEEAIRYFLDALEMAKELQDSANEGMWTGHLGKIYDNTGRYAQALPYYHAALEIAQRVGDRRNEGIWYGNIAFVQIYLGDHLEALNGFEKAIAIAREVNDQRYVGIWSSYLGHTLADLGRYDEALVHQQDGLKIARDMNNKFNEVYRLIDMGLTYLKSGRSDQALTTIRASIDLATEIQNYQERQYQLTLLGQIYLQLDRLEEAGSALEEASKFSSEWNNHRTLTTRGIVFARLHAPVEASEAFRAAIAHAESLLTRTANSFDPKYYKALSLAGLGLTDEEGSRAGYIEESAQMYQRALRNCSAVGIVRYADGLFQMLQLADASGSLASIDALFGR